MLKSVTEGQLQYTVGQVTNSQMSFTRCDSTAYIDFSEDATKLKLLPATELELQQN